MIFMNKRGGFLTSNSPTSYIDTRARRFVYEVFCKSYCMNNCVALIDGTLIGNAHPESQNMLQHVAYNGQKQKLALKY